MSTALVRGRKFGQEFTSEELLLLIKQQQKKSKQRLASLLTTTHFYDNLKRQLSVYVFVASIQKEIWTKGKLIRLAKRVNYELLERKVHEL